MTERDYWDSVKLSAEEAAEQIRENDDDYPGMAGDVVAEAGQETVWSIYTHKAGLTMLWTDNADAIFDYGLDTSSIDSWSALVCLAASCSHSSDVSDFYYRNYDESGEPIGPAAKQTKKENNNEH